MASNTQTGTGYDPFDTAALWQAAPICWKHLDHDAIQRHLADLTDWVHWLVTRYAIAPRTLPPCWARHGSILEELSALRTGWLAAYAPDAPGNAPMDWHTMLAATKTRLDETISRTGCTKDTHRDDQIPQ